MKKLNIKNEILNIGGMVIVVSWIFYLLGCASAYKQNKSPSVLEPQSILRFSDVPVPAAFKMLPQESYTFESAGVRVGVLKYTGKADADQVVNFFKEQMPMYNWNLLNVVEYGQRQLNFDRDTESCIVTLSPKGSRVNLVISVGPKPQLSKRLGRPVK